MAPHNPAGKLIEPDPPLESTLDLLYLAKAGDRDAVERLLARCVPPLRRWASGRLPRWTRDLMDTDDLVNETVLRAVNRLHTFEPRHDGALVAYLRKAVMNRIRDEVARRKRMPPQQSLDDNHADRGASPLEEAIGREAVERYEAALGRLREEDREAIIARVEMESSYEEVAKALGKPSSDAARMAVGRALVRLAREMNRGI
jgi:RNA polymerase sigma-70 factor, ECF subfamily